VASLNGAADEVRLRVEHTLADEEVNLASEAGRERTRQSSQMRFAPTRPKRSTARRPSSSRQTAKRSPASCTTT
jgi:hypothetical protein